MSARVVIEAIWQGAQAQAGIDKTTFTLKNMAMELGKMFGAAVALDQLRKGFTASWQAAEKNQQSISDLNFSLQRFGRTAGDVEPLIERLRRSSEFDDEQFRAALDNMATGTGDYARSLKNLDLVADVAAARNMDLVSSSQLVSQAMQGITRGVGMAFPQIRTYVESLDAIEDPALRGQMALDKLRETVGGRAAAEIRTAAAIQHEFNEELGETAEGIMRQTMALEGWGAALKVATEGLRGLKDHTPVLELLAGLLTGGPQGGISAVLSAWFGPNDAEDAMAGAHRAPRGGWGSGASAATLSEHELMANARLQELAAQKKLREALAKNRVDLRGDVEFFTPEEWARGVARNDAASRAGGRAGMRRGPDGRMPGFGAFQGDYRPGGRTPFDDAHEELAAEAAANMAKLKGQLSGVFSGAINEGLQDGLPGFVRGLGAGVRSALAQGFADFLAEGTADLIKSIIPGGGIFGFLGSSASSSASARAASMNLALRRQRLA